MSMHRHPWTPQGPSLLCWCGFPNGHPCHDVAGRATLGDVTDPAHSTSATSTDDRGESPNADGDHSTARAVAGSVTPVDTCRPLPRFSIELRYNDHGTMILWTLSRSGDSMPTVIDQGEEATWTDAAIAASDAVNEMGLG